MSPPRILPQVPEHRPEIGDPVWQEVASHITVRYIANKGNGAHVVELDNDPMIRHVVAWNPKLGWVSVMRWNVTAPKQIEFNAAS